jgi:CRP/FNR family transcriptional regulator, cyclic AMP receptor protein
MAQSGTAQQAQSLARISVFKKLPPDSLAKIEKRCSWHTYKPGEPIVDYLDASDDVYFIATGEARASIYSVAGKAVTFSDLGPGDMFGEYAAIDGTPRSVGIEARTRCVIAVMTAETFRELLHAEPVVMLALLRQLVGKIRSLTTRVYEFSTLAVNNRIQAELLRLAGLVPRQGKSARILTPPTHAEIASRVSTHREAVSRELGRLAKIGLIERRRGALVVTDLDRLAAMVQEVTGE